MKRGSGILMHITSLPQEEGIGTLGRCAYRFADFLKETSQMYWQILPLGPTGYGNSPYQSFSAFAGNPYLIDLEILVEEGLLLDEEYVLFLRKGGNDFIDIDFNYIEKNKMKILYLAYQRARENKDIVQRIDRFKLKEEAWLDDYSLFMAIKQNKDQVNWQGWEQSLKCRDKKVLSIYRKELKEEINFWMFLQYEFYRQWENLKSYVNSLGIKIIGDIPIYVAADSSDTWSHPEYFKLDEHGNPTSVAGCPPDAFSEDGQLWGNPIYDWDYMEKDKFNWWIARMKQNSKLFDVVRIDHFRGFEAFWEVPYGDQTARGGKWTQGPGIKLFRAIKKKLGNIDIIAEDLGFITEEVIKLRKTLGYMGMNILEFAFDPSGKSIYIPHNCKEDTVSYIGTHDNETIMGWIAQIENKKQVNFAKQYLKLNKREGYNWGFIRGTFSTPSAIAIIQMQDILGLDNRARMNTPATIGGNWVWRMAADAIKKEHINKLKEITQIYGRANDNIITL